jgi:hypothetical protein
MSHYLPMRMPSSTKTIVGLSPLEEEAPQSSRPTVPDPPRRHAPPAAFAPAQRTLVGAAPPPRVTPPPAAVKASVTPPPLATAAIGTAATSPAVEAADAEVDAGELPMSRSALTLLAAATVVFVWLLTVALLFGV